MTVPTATIDDTRSTTVNVIIDEVLDTAHVASINWTATPKSFPIQPRSAPDPIGMYQYSAEVTGQITFETAGPALDRFLLGLASSGNESYKPGGVVMPGHTLRINDPVDTDHDHDLFLHKVIFGAVSKSYAEGETAKLKPSLSFTAHTNDAAGDDKGKLFSVGHPLPEAP